MEKVTLAKSTRIGNEIKLAGSVVEVNEETKAMYIKKGIIADETVTATTEIKVDKELNQKLEDTLKENESLKLDKQKLEDTIYLMGLTVDKIKEMVKGKVDIGKLTDKDEIIKAIVESDFVIEKQIDPLVG